MGLLISTKHEEGSCFFQLSCTLIDETALSFTEEDADKAVASTSAKKVNEQDIKMLCW